MDKKELEREAITLLELNTPFDVDGVDIPKNVRDAVVKELAPAIALYIIEKDNPNV